MAAPVTAHPTAPPGDPTAVFGRRVGAFVIDTLVIAVPGVAAFSSQMESWPVADTSGTDWCDSYTELHPEGSCVRFEDTAYFHDGSFEITSLVPLALSVLLLVVVQGLTGWTIGKLVTGIRTVREDGRVVGMPRAFVRWLFLIVDMLPCIGLVGLITAGTSTGHRRVGDMAAKTYVVRRSAAGSPIAVPGMPGVASAGPSGAAYGAPGSWSTGSSWDASSAPAPSPVDPTAPQWDAERGTYIQWDPHQSRWLQWDDSARTWSPIPGQ